MALALPAQAAEGPASPGDDAPAADDTAHLWQRWRGERDALARQGLIERHQRYARIIAARCYAQRQRDGITFNEYVQLASLGLIEAVDRYDPVDARASFESYAGHRIRGAVLNGLASLSEVNAQLEARRRVRRERLGSLVAGPPELADHPAPADAEAGGASGRALRDSRARLAQLADVATGIALGLMLDDLRIYAEVEPVGADNCYADAEMRKLRQTLSRLVQGLPERERALVRGHYFEDQPLETLARQFGVTKGRVSQLHKRALALLQAQMRSQGQADWSI